MSRKTILIILAIVIVLLGAWVFVESKKTVSQGGTASKSFLGSLFPFGSSTQLPTGTTTGGFTTTETGTATSTPSAPDPLVKIFNGPTAGYTVIVPPPVIPPPSAAKKKSTKTITVAAPSASAQTATSTSVSMTATATPVAPVYPTVRYAQSGTGYVYDVGARGGTANEVSATVVARTAQALFGNNGQTIIFRYVDTDNQTIETYLSHLVPSTATSTPGTVTGLYLADDITDLVMSPDQKSFEFLVSTDDGGSVAETMKDDGTGEAQAFTSAFDEWLLDWSALGTVVTSKAANGVDGYAYKMSSDGTMVRVVGPVDGLTTKMSPDGTSVLYSVSTATGISLHILHLKDGTDLDTGLSTLPEKCTWTSDGSTVYCGASATANTGTYPDDWYQGIAHFNDALWRIDAATGTTTELDTGEGNYLDAINLQLDSTGTFLLFIDKTDGSLWSFDLSPTLATTTQ